MKLQATLLAASTVLGSIAFAGTPGYSPTETGLLPSGDLLSKARRPISNPTLFDLALPTTQLHPIFLHHRLPNTVSAAGGQVPMGGDVRLYALQFEWAFNERLSLVATKDGYVDIDPGNAIWADESGFANLAAGLKYAFLLDPAAGRVLSGTATFELPTGNRDVFQGEGDGAVNLIVSGLQMAGDWQFAGGAGLHLPFSDQMSTSGFVSAHASYEVRPWFIPLVELNWFHVLSPGDGSSRFGSQPPVAAIASFEGHDLLNFGATDSGSNRDLVTAAIGFRSRLTDRVDVGVAYEIPLSDSNDSVLKDRLTLDLVWRF